MELTLDTPARYRIRVKGYLNSSWSDRLGGLAITSKIRDDGPTVTTLRGELRDQAALAGVLSALYNLHLPLLSVDYVGDVLDGVEDTPREHRTKQPEPAKMGSD
jgi:hypothetical protein